MKQQVNNKMKTTMEIRNFIRRGARSMMLGVLVFAAAGVEASTETSPEKLKAMYNANVRRDITDADFFGSFKGGSWAKQPMLSYAYSPQLKSVETAAKAGDYEQAGVELLAYFQNQYSHPQAKPGGSKSLRVAMWQDNIFGFDQQLSVLSEFDVGQQAEDLDINISSTSSFPDGLTTFMLMGRHKNGVVSFVASRDSRTPPMLWLQFDDGTTQGFKAVADAYIRPGTFSQQNYGTAETLEVCNSGLKTGKAFDDDTRRTFIAFDLAKVDVKKIKHAKLKIRAWSDESAQKMLLFHVRPTALNEAEITWDNNTGYLYSWEGLPGGVHWDQPAGAHSQFPNWTQRLYWLKPMTAWAVASNDPQEERVTLDLIRDFIADYPTFEDVVDYWMRDEMNGAGRIDHGYSYCLHALLRLEACTPRDCVELLKQVVRDSDTLYINASKLTSGNTGNMGMTLMSSLIRGALAFPELANSQLWLDDATQRLDANLKSMVLDDGAYIEHTFGYPFGVLSQMLNVLELFQKNDLNAPAVLAQKAQQLARYLMFCSMPDGFPIKWGEGVGGNTRISPVIRRAAKYFKDPEMQWWTSEGKTGHMPKVTNVSYPEARIAVLRDSWEPDANVLFFSPRVGGGHYHVDQNSLVLYAYGQKLLNDTGMSSYHQGHPHFFWQRHQGKSHNTVEIDEQGYPRFDRRVNPTEEGPCSSKVFISDHAGLLEGWAEGYPDVRHRRTIFSIQEAGIYFVSDFLTSKDEEIHTYDQSWHIYPLNSYESDAETCQVWTTNDMEANVEIKPLYPQQLELLLRDGFNAVPLTDTVYPSFRQQTVGPAEFLTLLNPTRPGVPVKSLKAKLLDATEGARAAAVVTADGTGVFVIRTTAEGWIQAGSVETDARCAYVQLDQAGQVKWTVRAGGSMIKVAGQPVASEVLRKITEPRLPEPQSVSKK